MTDARINAQVDALLLRLQVPATPDDAFVRTSLVEVLPHARRARAQDRTFVGRMLRDLRTSVSRPSAVAARLIPVMMALLLAALLLAALLVVVGSQRRLPAPFGVAANGEIAYVVEGHVVVADVNGANPRQLTFDAGLQLDPVFSRDGTRFAFRRFRLENFGTDRDRADVVVARSDGSGQVVIAADVNVLSHPAWSPDGRTIAFSGSMGGLPTAVYVAPSDGSGPLTTVSTITGAWDPVWSPDGQRLAFGAANGKVAGLYVVDRDGKGRHRVTKFPYPEVGQKGESAEWSPDGRFITFTGGDPGGPSQVYVVSLDGSPEWNISGYGYSAAHGTWSPDGSRIAFLHSGDGSGPVVVITDPMGGHYRQLPGQYAWFQPIWSPDGTRIIVTDDRPGTYNEPGPAIRVILDAIGDAPPIEIPAAGTTPDTVPDWAASWQRLAPP